MVMSSSVSQPPVELTQPQSTAGAAKRKFTGAFNPQDLGESSVRDSSDQAACFTDDRTATAAAAATLLVGERPEFAPAASAPAPASASGATAGPAADATAVPGPSGQQAHRRKPFKRLQTAKPTRKCQGPDDCTVSPSYNFPGQTKRLFCAAHKQEGMVNLCKTACAEPGCSVNPRFNHPHTTSGKYCNNHRKEGMINVVDRRCAHTGCLKFPTHNFPGTHRRLYCASHKLPGMKDMS